MNEEKELTPNLDKLQEYVIGYWQKGIPDWNVLLNNTIKDITKNNKLSIILKQWDLTKYRNEIIAFAGYYVITWTLFQTHIRSPRSWKTTAFTDYNKLFDFIKSNNIDKIILSAKDDKHAVKNHIIRNPKVIEDFNILFEHFFNTTWQKKQEEYFQFERLSKLLIKAFPIKQNIRLSFNESLTFLALFLKKETKLKDGPKTDIYKFLEEFCSAFAIDSLPENIDDLKKYVKI
jgi:hypothetical protein